MDWLAVRRRLSAAAAVGLAMGSGCGPAVDPDGGDRGDTSTSTSGGTSNSSTTRATTNATTASGPTSPSATSLGDTGPRYDLGDARFDLGSPPNYDMGVGPPHCAPEGEPVECDVELERDQLLRTFCVDLLEGESCDDVTEDEFDLAAASCLQCWGFAEPSGCERFALDEQSCCAWMVVRAGQSCPGRPFLVDGEARIPLVVPRDDWSRPLRPSVETLSSSARVVLAQAWAAEGCHEAASVGSFSRFVLQLLSLGAPASLIARAHQALADEIEHAKAFFGLAAAYGGVAVGPDSLPIEGSLRGASDPTEVAVSLAREGCIAETISAMQLALAASRAEDIQVRAMLSEIAEQELRHAELAWSALGWMLRNGSDAMRMAVADAFSRAKESVPRAVSIADTLDEHTLRAVGRLTERQRLDTATRALANCISPAAVALLEPWTSPAPSTRHEMTAPVRARQLSRR